MFAIGARLWRDLRPVWRKPLSHQPFIILYVLLGVAAWVAAAAIICTARFATVVVGQAAFVGGIVLCLLGLGYLGAPLGVAGLIASRLAA